MHYDYWVYQKHLEGTLSVCVCVLVAQLCLTLCSPMDCSLSGSSVHGILQARTLKWVAISHFRGSSWPRDQTCVSCFVGGFFTFWATREAPLFLRQPFNFIHCIDKTELIALRRTIYIRVKGKIQHFTIS